jgi:hypothetical protein
MVSMLCLTLNLTVLLCLSSLSVMVYTKHGSVLGDSKSADVYVLQVRYQLYSHLLHAMIRFLHTLTQQGY